MTNDEYRAKYTPTIKYPNKDDFVTVYVYSKGIVEWSGSQNAFRRLPSSPNIVLSGKPIEKVLDEAAYRAARAEYSLELGRLEALFKHELFAEHGVVGHHKAEKCFAIAWDYGHSSGYGEVASYFDTLVELIKD